LVVQKKIGEKGVREKERVNKRIFMLFVVVGNCCCGKPIAKIGCAAAK
jgi:hypothetical protein